MTLTWCGMTHKLPSAMPESNQEAPRYKDFEGLRSPKDKMLVAKYGEWARPLIDDDCSKDIEMRNTVFRYVYDVYAAKRSGKGVSNTLQLYQCLVEALRIGDSKVFKYVVMSIDKIIEQPKYGWKYPQAVMLLAEYYPRLLKKNRNLWEAWGEDMIPPAAEILARHRSKSSVRQLHRLAKVLGIELKVERAPGRPAKKKALPEKTLPKKANRAK